MIPLPKANRLTAECGDPPGRILVLPALAVQLSCEVVGEVTDARLQDPRAVILERTAACQLLILPNSYNCHL